MRQQKTPTVGEVERRSSHLPGFRVAFRGIAVLIVLLATAFGGSSAAAHGVGSISLDPEIVSIPPVPSVMVYTNMKCTATYHLQGSDLSVKLCKFIYDTQEPPRAASGWGVVLNDGPRQNYIEWYDIYNMHDGSKYSSSCGSGIWMPAGTRDECYHQRGYAGDVYGIEGYYLNRDSGRTEYFNYVIQ